MYYAIERIGNGRLRRYAIKQVINKALWPVNGKVYNSEEAAEKAACEMGIKIEKRGDIWEII